MFCVSRLIYDMHGRLKVPTSEEQKAQKQKERDQKLSAFVFVRDKIWAKRLSGQFRRAGWNIRHY